tara:strand:+ start:608 stop:982 length:375 start_codon:yes stop_codon:yes gene_type:complete
MGFFKTEWFVHTTYEGVVENPACNSCGRNSHNLLTWIACRIGQIDAHLYFTFDSYNWLVNKWWDFQERFNKCSFCGRLNLFRKIGYHSYWGAEEQLGNRYNKKWCQYCWNERVGEGGCGYVHDL